MLPPWLVLVTAAVGSVLLVVGLAVVAGIDNKTHVPRGTESVQDLGLYAVIAGAVLIISSMVLSYLPL